MQKWEYMFLSDRSVFTEAGMTTYNNTTVDAINVQGQCGWELVSRCDGGFYFKRPLPEEL